MQQQVLSPGMQNADACRSRRPDVWDRAAIWQHGLRAGGEQQIVEQTWVLQRQHVEFVRHGEHDVEVAGGKQFAFARGEPAFARLAPGTSGSAGCGRSCRRWPWMIRTVGTGIEMTAQRRGAAARNGPESFELLKAETRLVPVQEAIALRAEDVGHLHGGPGHSCRCLAV